MKPAFQAPCLDLERGTVTAFARKESVFAWNWHYHPELELTWIRKGHGTRLVGDHSDRYGPDDLVLLGSNLPHTWFSASGGDGRASRRNEAIVVQWRPRAIPDAVAGLPEFAGIGQLLTRAGLGLRFAREAVGEVGGAIEALLGADGIDRWLGLARILDTLATAQARPLASERYRHRRSHTLSSRLERVVAFVDCRFRDDLPLREMAKLAGLTPSAFSKFFRKMTHHTFVAYRNHCRIREACRQLIETDRSITEIAFDCGFNNLANFNRRFRFEKQMIPSEFRRLHSAGSGVARGRG